LKLDQEACTNAGEKFQWEQVLERLENGEGK